MTNQELHDRISHKPAVHKLFYGAYFQESLILDDNVLLVPLKAFGFDSQSNYTAQYVIQILGGHVDNDGLKNLQEQGKNALPVFALIAFLDSDSSPEDLEKRANIILEAPELILSWSSGDDFSLFAICTVTEENTFFRLTPPHSRRRRRLGFGNTGEQYANLLKKLIEAEKQDEHFSFALSMFHDAVREKNPRYQIARFFSCLECLAYKLKNKERESRKAVKYLIGLGDDTDTEYDIEGVKYRFDRIEISGRLRDKLYHGVDFKESDLNNENKHVFKLLENYPQMLADSLHEDCKLEISKWANGVSSGLVE